MTKAQDLFRAKAPGVMDRLMAEFPLWNEIDAAADLGNLGHESGGLATLQETSPTVKGSKGGYGWAQWTGPRRRAFEAWCKANKLNPASDDANLGFHLVELHGAYGSTIAKVHAAKGLEAKVKAFELSYEGAGIKHYDRRNQWAHIALDAWLNAHRAKPAGKPASAQQPPPATSDTAAPSKPAASPPPVAQDNNPPPAAAVKKKWFAGILAAIGIGGAGGAVSWHTGEFILFGGLALVLVVVVGIWLHGRKA